MRSQITFEKITGNKQLTRYIHIVHEVLPFVFTWPWRCGVLLCPMQKNTQGNQSIVDFSANRRQLNDALAHVVDCVLFGCSVASLPLQRVRTRTQFLWHFRRIADDQRQSVRIMWIFRCECAFVCFWKGSLPTTHIHRNAKSINKQSFRGEESAVYQFLISGTAFSAEKQIGIYLRSIYLKRLRHTVRRGRQ